VRHLIPASHLVCPRGPIAASFTSSKACLPAVLFDFRVEYAPFA